MFKKGARVLLRHPDEKATIIKHAGVVRGHAFYLVHLDSGHRTEVVRDNILEEIV